nr:MAG TPA: capsid protein [Bacteriophage sp.]
MSIGKKKTYSKKYNKKALSASAKASKALYLVKRSIRNEEVKYKNGATFTTLITQSLQIVHLTTVASGDEAEGRDGNKINLMGIKLMLHLNNTPASNINTGCIVRVLIIQDSQQQADTAPNAAELLNITGLAYNALYQYPQVAHRFRILADRYINLNPTGAYGLTTPAFQSTALHAHRVYNIRPKFKHIYYNGANATDIQKNGVYFCICKSSSDASNTLTPELNWQLKYTDA